MVPEVCTKTYQVCRMVPEVCTKTYQVCRMVPEQRVKTCAYQVCRMVPEQKVKTCTCRLPHGVSRGQDLHLSGLPHGSKPDPHLHHRSAA
jgi:hypothetical protein